MDRKRNGGRKTAGRTEAPGKAGRNEKDWKTGRTDKAEKTGKNGMSGKKSPADGQMAAPDHLLAGRNPVMEALKSGRQIEKILLLKGAEGSVKKIEGMARDQNIEIQYVQRNALDRMTDGASHQGVAAFVSGFQYCEPEDLIAAAEEKGEDPFLLILDGIEDPHNLGAIIRTADAAGAHGVIIPKRRAAAVTPIAEKAAAGAAEYVPVARVANIARTIDELKERGIWIAAADMDGAEVWQTDLTGPIALVIGSEGNGVSRLVREKCDYIVSFPMLGRINSLNASNAAALLMYEVFRQRRNRSVSRDRER